MAKNRAGKPYERIGRAGLARVTPVTQTVLAAHVGGGEVLEARVSAMADRLAVAFERIDQLEQRAAAAADPADVDLMRAIAQTIGGRTFTARQLWTHAAITLDLSAALVACDVTDPHTLGRVLRRLSRAVGGQLRVERVGDSRSGARWRVVVLSAARE